MIDDDSHLALTMAPREAIAHVLQAAGVMATTTMLPVVPRIVTHASIVGVCLSQYVHHLSAA